MQEQEQLGQGLLRLGGAMQRMQARQQAALQAIAARAQEIQAQANRLAEHMQRFAALGEKAAEATRLLQQLQAADEGAPRPDAALAEVEGRLLAISDEAKALVASADAADLSEISKEAGSLRQRIDSARGRLTQLLRSSSKPLVS